MTETAYRVNETQREIYRRYARLPLPREIARR